MSDYDIAFAVVMFVVFLIPATWGFALGAVEFEESVVHLLAAITATGAYEVLTRD